MTRLGIYIHVPFCKSKCPYCDFYSLPVSSKLIEAYLSRLEREIGSFEGKGIVADTLYFGGGTPSLLSPAQIGRLVGAARQTFLLEETAEITLELNPESVDESALRGYKSAGINRLSIGLQSANEQELRFLGRAHSLGGTARVMQAAQSAGMDNISLDLMLGLTGQTEQSIRKSAEFCRQSGARHVSAYLLKIEPGTRFFDQRETLHLPDDDRQAELYLIACQALMQAGFAQYEISNFAHKDYESRHNLKYWNAEEYLGFGPSAHSFWGGRRFYYERNLQGYIRTPEKKDDGAGGGAEEYLMLRLRLCEGIVFKEYERRFQSSFPPAIKKKAEALIGSGFVVLDEQGIRLTPKGFLLSNTLTAELLYSDEFRETHE